MRIRMHPPDAAISVSTARQAAPALVCCVRPMDVSCMARLVLADAEQGLATLAWPPRRGQVGGGGRGAAKKSNACSIWLPLRHAHALQRDQCNPAWSVFARAKPLARSNNQEITCSDGIANGVTACIFADGSHLYESGCSRSTICSEFLPALLSDRTPADSYRGCTPGCRQRSRPRADS